MLNVLVFLGLGRSAGANAKSSLFLLMMNKLHKILKTLRGSVLFLKKFPEVIIATHIGALKRSKTFLHALPDSKTCVSSVLLHF